MPSPLDKFLLWINHAALMHRRDGKIDWNSQEIEEMAFDYDWNLVGNNAVESVGGWSVMGKKENQEKVLSIIAESLKSSAKKQAEAAAKAKALADNRRQRIFDAFAELGTEFASEEEIITLAVMAAATPGKMVATERAALEAEILTMIVTEKVLGRVRGNRANPGGLVLAVGPDGQETKTRKDLGEAVKFVDKFERKVEKKKR